MRKVFTPPSKLSRLVLVAGLALFGACVEQRSVVSPEALASKGGGKPGGGGNPVVSTVDPAYGRQGEVNKKVRILGSGFDDGSTATWTRNGTADPKVSVNSTRFVSTTELEADITIAEDAEVTLYDIVVETASRKSGIGTELFEVTPKDPTATFFLPSTQGSLGLWGDGHFTGDDSFPGTSRYKERECGVHSKIFASTAASNSGDAIMDPNISAYRDRKCVQYPRKISVDFRNPDPGSGATPGVVETVAARINLLALQNTTTGIPVDSTESRDLNLALTGSRTCDGLRFRLTLPAQGGIPTGADQVEVTRIDPVTWHVRTAPGQARAACLKNNTLVGRYIIPVDFYIVADDVP